MIVSQQKPFEEIIEMLKGEKSIFIIGCNGHLKICRTDGEKACSEIKEKLEEAKIKVNGCVIVDTICNKHLVVSKISQYKEQIDKADSIIAVSCGIGVQSLASTVDKYVHPANNTIVLGEFQWTLPSTERCSQCGDCVLDLTGGICPITKCTKSLLNGPCGGAKNGKCEIDKELDCGWGNICNRLKKFNKSENLQKFSVKLRDYSKMFPKLELSKSMFGEAEPR